MINESPSIDDLQELINYFQSSRFSEAEILAMSLTQDFPNHQISWQILGIIYSQTGREVEAVNANKEAVRIIPTDPEAHSNLGFSLQQVGRE